MANLARAARNEREEREVKAADLKRGIVTGERGIDFKRAVDGVLGKTKDFLVLTGRHFKLVKRLLKDLKRISSVVKPERFG